MRKYSSKFWNRADDETASDKHNCIVTSKIAKYNKLLLGKISKTLAAADIPYVLAIKMVVITDNVQVAVLWVGSETSIRHERSREKKCGKVKWNIKRINSVKFGRYYQPIHNKLHCLFRVFFAYLLQSSSILDEHQTEKQLYRKP